MRSRQWVGIRLRLLLVLSVFILLLIFIRRHLDDVRFCFLFTRLRLLSLVAVG
jgi:uncharacterized integral membrane protein